MPRVNNRTGIEEADCATSATELQNIFLNIFVSYNGQIDLLELKTDLKTDPEKEVKKRREHS